MRVAADPHFSKHFRNPHRPQFAMNLTTVIWSAAAASCVTLALVHLLFWCWNRESKASLWFAGTAMSVALVACIELAMMRAQGPADFLALHRWGHLAFFVVILCIVGFVQSYYRTGRRWLVWSLIGLRLVILVLAFVPGPTFNFREITAMEPVVFWGETVMIPRGIRTPWEFLGNASGLLLLAFVIDAAFQLQRRGNTGEKRRAPVMAVGVVLFILSCAVNGILIHHGKAQVPYFITLSFLFVIAAMKFELSRDMLHAARLADEVRENAESMRLAAGAGELALWRWDIPRDGIWVSPGGRELYGIPPEQTINIQSVLDTLHDDDRKTVSELITRAFAGSGAFQAVYRVKTSHELPRWISARGKTEFAPDGAPVRMRGVSVDVTSRILAEQDAARHRDELAHLSRVTTLNELSGSLAHEIYQPLAIILSNAQAAQRLLARTPPDLDEVREILVDIVDEDRRAGQVIERLRSLFKRGETRRMPVILNDIVDEALALTQHNLVARGVTTKVFMASGLPQVMGDRIQLQQVLLNLLLNAADAMSVQAPETRHIHLSTARSGDSVRLTVRDEGPGLPADVEKIFQPFNTSKPDGLGLGLAISRSIVTAHGGRIWAESHSGQGAVFHVEIPVMNLHAT
jgi:signal transduction histidine kinase